MLSVELVLLKQKCNLKIPSVETRTEHLASPVMPDNSYAHVLVMAGIELIFFLLAGTVLGFGFSVRIMLITH